jgi:hypothetical protein
MLQTCANVGSGVLRGGAPDKWICCSRGTHKACIFIILRDYKIKMVRSAWQNSLATFCEPTTLSTTFSTEDGVWNRNEKRPRKGRKSVKTEVLHQLYFTVTAPQTKRAAQMARGPRSSLMGSMNMALRSPKTPFTAIPTRRKGSVSNHTMG